MTTQAGATEDEDFPGLAALVSPDGQVARLPDWRPGSLVVEVAADVTVHPVREAVRCLLVDPAHVSSLAAESIAELRWWSADELRASAAVATPRDLPGLLDRVARRDLPGPDEDLGV